MIAVAEELSVGDFVRWISGGVEQWGAPRRLVHIEELNGVLYGFCDGSLTGFLLGDLVRD